MKLTPRTEGASTDRLLPEARTRKTLRIRNIWHGLLSCIVNLFISDSDIPSTWFGKTEPAIKKIWFRIGSTSLRIKVWARKKGQRLQGSLNLLANLICRLQKNLPKSKIKAHQTHSALVIGFCKVIVYRLAAPFFILPFHLALAAFEISKKFLYRKGFPVLSMRYAC